MRGSPHTQTNSLMVGKSAGKRKRPLGDQRRRQWMVCRREDKVRTACMACAAARHIPAWVVSHTCCRVGFGMQTQGGGQTACRERSNGLPNWESLWKNVQDTIEVRLHCRVARKGRACHYNPLPYLLAYASAGTGWGSHLSRLAHPLSQGLLCPGRLWGLKQYPCQSLLGCCCLRQESTKF